MTSPLVQRLKPSHLRLICAVHDHGKLQLAADTVGMSQPAASRMLSDIEADAGTPLFERLPRGMQATPVGAAFVRHARFILAEIDTLSSEVAQLKDGTAGAVRVGAVTGPAVGALVPALVSLRAENPGIRPTIEVAPSVTLVRGLEEGRFDFVLARVDPQNDLGAFHAYPGRSETVSLLVNATHPLAGRRISLAETLPFEFVIQEPGSPIRTSLETAFLASRLAVPSQVTNSSSLLIALNVIAESHAIAPQTREVAQILTRIAPGLTILDTEETIEVPNYLVLQLRHRELPPIAQRLLEDVMRRL